MKKYKLQAEKRKTLGKKVKNLRKQGVLPANLYGKSIKSESLQLPGLDFEKLFKEAGETGLVELTLVGEEKSRPVLIHNLQRDPISGLVLHADFYQVDLKEKVKSMVPIEIVGEALAVKDKKGVLLQTLTEIEIEALPTDLPENFQVDITNLVDVDQEIKVEDLKAPAGVAILTDGTLGICKIGALVTAEMEAEIKKEEEEAAAQAAETAGEAPAAEEAPGEEFPKEGAPEKTKE
ncbi:50S ribosomal protein L25 [Candidatus Microgenomates bacterium]|nr:50S ribosomal protein L25 [Candidatus Microgenomates bacterium]